MSFYALDDRRSDAELPDGAAGVCEACGEPAGQLVDGLGECCRCWDCGEVNAPVERDEERYCRPCAFDRNIFAPLFWPAID